MSRRPVKADLIGLRSFDSAELDVARSGGLVSYEEKKMSKNTWIKWGLLMAGSTVAALQLGNCIAQWALQTFILNAVN